METLGISNIWIVIVALVWTLPWKGYALWTAAKAGHKKWFIALIILNTFAILDIIYIFYIAKKTTGDISAALKKKV